MGQGLSLLVVLGITSCSGSKPEQATAPTPAASPTSPVATPTPESPLPSVATQPFEGGAKPSIEAAATPSPSPSTQPSATPSVEPSTASSAEPSTVPSAQPTQAPSPNDGQPNPATPGLVAFTDISEVPTKKYVTELQALNVFETTEPTFRPYEPVTRGEYITWLYQANNTMRRDKEHLRLDPTFDPEFSDLSPAHPAYKYVQAFANAGYAVGYDDKTFKPDQPITREEMIAIKIGLDTEKNHKPTTLGLKYSDTDQIDSRYTGFIRIDHVHNNIERAFGNVKTLKPKQVVKRHEAAATLWKIGYDTAEKALKKQAKP